MYIIPVTILLTTKSHQPMRTAPWPTFGSLTHQLWNTDWQISCLFVSLPVCERFRPLRVCGDLSKSFSAGTSDDGCMEAELGPVREKKQHRPLTSAKSFLLISQCCSSSVFLAVSEQKMKLNLRLIRFRFHWGFCLHMGPRMTWQRCVLRVTNKKTGRGMWKIRSWWKDKAPRGSVPIFSICETVWAHLSDWECNFHFSWVVWRLN